MTDSIGLSIGMTNLVAARVGDPPVTRRAVLTLYPNRAAEVGVPSERSGLRPSGSSPTEPGVVLSGFVERVGDPVPLVASDGSSHSADWLLVEALDAMAHTVTDRAPDQMTIAVPAHWGPAVLGALRGMLRTKPHLSPGGVPAQLVPDAAAGLAALRTSPGLPESGVVALLDFGGSGTSITLADASQSGGADFQPVDETLRYTEFSGAQIDQALLTNVLADISRSSGADPAGTTAVGALTRLREQCRLAKERLSAETATDLTAELPGYQSDIRVTRAELESLIAEPLRGAIGALEEMLQRNRIPVSSLSAVATVGGGAAIPLITQRLSEQLRVPVVTTPQPALNIAAGAALLATRGPGADMATGLAAAGVAASESATDGAASATFRALAWSQDEGVDEPVPYAGADYDPDATSARPPMEFSPPPDEPPVAEAPLPWYRRPQVIFGAALLAVLLATGGLVWTLTSESGPMGSKKSSTPTSYAYTNPESPGVPLTEPTTIVKDGSSTVVGPPPPGSSTGPAPSSSTTTTPSTTSTTTTTTTTTPTTTTTTTPTTTTTKTTTTSTSTSTSTPTASKPNTPPSSAPQSPVEDQSGEPSSQANQSPQAPQSPQSPGSVTITIPQQP